MRKLILSLLVSGAFLAFSGQSENINFIFDEMISYRNLFPGESEDIRATATIIVENDTPVSINGVIQSGEGVTLEPFEAEITAYDLTRGQRVFLGSIPQEPGVPAQGARLNISIEEQADGSYLMHYHSGYGWCGTMDRVYSFTGTLMEPMGL